MDIAILLVLVDEHFDFVAHDFDLGMCGFELFLLLVFEFVEIDEFVVEFLELVVEVVVDLVGVVGGGLELLVEVDEFLGELLEFVALPLDGFEVEVEVALELLVLQSEVFEDEVGLLVELLVLEGEFPVVLALLGFELELVVEVVDLELEG